MTPHFDTERHPITDDAYVARCRSRLAHDGALVLPGFAQAETIERIVAEAAMREAEAFYAGTTHNVYLTPSNPALPLTTPSTARSKAVKG